MLFYHIDTQINSEYCRVHDDTYFMIKYTIFLTDVNSSVAIATVTI